jgi:hypothetical protein
MKTRRLFLWLFIIVAVLAVVVVWYNNRQAKTSVRTPTENNIATTADQPVLEANRTNANVPVQATVVVETNHPMPPMKDKGEQMKEGLAKLNDNEVVFYGRVIDQFGSPVPDATVSGIVQVNNGTRVGTDRMSTTTDGNGLFTISGYKGKNLGIQVAQSGYIMATTNTSFIYSYLWPESQRYVPDSSNPTIIKMWKLQKAEPLVGLNKDYKLQYTDAPINFDLLAGKIVPAGGDLKITVHRPDGIISQQHPQNWSIQIEVVNGGLIETSGRESAVTFTAPDGIYQPSGDFGNDSGSDVTQRALFIQSRNGQIYSKLGFSFRINNKPDDLMYVSFSGVANTNGSRNWEATAPR